MGLPGALLVFLAYNGCGWQQAVGFMCLALFFNGAISASCIVNHTDIAPNYAGKSLTLLITYHFPSINKCLNLSHYTMYSHI